MQAKHKNTGRWEGVKPRLSHFQVYLTAKKCGPGGRAGVGPSVSPCPTRKLKKEKTSSDGGRRQGRKTEDRPGCTKRKTNTKKKSKTRRKTKTKTRPISTI
jgi:hypothetical protein